MVVSLKISFFPMAFFMSLSNIDCSSFLGRFWCHCFLSSSDLLRLLWTVYILQMELILISIFPLPVSGFGTAWELNRVLWGWLSLWLCPLCFLICHVTPSSHPTPPPLSLTKLCQVPPLWLHHSPQILYSESSSALMEDDSQKPLANSRGSCPSLEL